MKAVYLFCAVLILALSSSTPAHADTSTSATPTTDTGYGESPATDTPVGTECREYIPADTAAAPALSAAHDAPRPRGFWFYFKTTLFCLRDLIIGFGFGAITGGVAAGLFSRTKFTVKRVLIKGAIIGCLLGGAASIVVAYLFRTRRSNDRLPAFRITGKYCGRLPNGRGQGCRAIARHPCPLIPRRVTPEVSGQARHLLT